MSQENNMENNRQNAQYNNEGTMTMRDVWGEESWFARHKGWMKMAAIGIAAILSFFFIIGLFTIYNINEI